MKKTEVIEIFQPKKEEKLFRLLNSFGIKADSVKLEQKRFFDIYDIKLANGIRSSRLDRVLVDIGMSLSSYSHPSGSPILREGIYRIEVQREEIATPFAVSGSPIPITEMPILTGIITVFIKVSLN